MKTANLPRSIIGGKFKDFPCPVTADDWLISITDAGWFDADVEYPFERILFTHFNDTENEGEGEIQDEQAEEIAAFIKTARELKKNVWVNCHAGISRSGAVTQLLIDLGWEFHNSLKSPQRIPNCLVYNKVRQHFPELTQSWDSSNQDIWTAAAKDW